MTEQRSHELERRRDELARTLPGLSREQAASYRRNNDAPDIDAEIERAPRRGLGARFGRTVRRARADR